MAQQLSTGIKGAGVPQDAIPFLATNTTSCAAAATAQTIRAAVAGKRKWITRAYFTNTEASVGLINLTDGTTHKAKCVVNASTVEQVYDPPLAITAGALVAVDMDSDVGECWITIVGYEEK
jgi:hypothetical protein